MNSGARARTLTTWFIVVTVVCAFVVVPFVLWEDALTSWSESVLDRDRALVVVAVAVAFLLASDFALPVPSSIVLVFAGARFGVVGGVALAWVGLMLGCLFAYAAGRYLGRPALSRLVGDEVIERGSAHAGMRGVYGVIGCRAVPVLAETSVILAGMTKMPILWFLAAVGVANVVVAGVYVSIGTYVAETGSLLVAFAATIALPLALMLLSRPGKLVGWA